jgi:hypothetical protein
MFFVLVAFEYYSNPIHWCDILTFY